MVPAASKVIEGQVAHGFEAVRDAFEDNSARRHELGGACCVYRLGEKVVDLWGGVRNEVTGDPRDVAIRDALYAALRAVPPQPSAAEAIGSRPGATRSSHVIRQNAACGKRAVNHHHG